MNNSFIGAIRGPILMMTLGGMLALDHFTEYRLWRLWPLLLIVLGLLKLAERLMVPPPAGPEAGGN